MSNKDFEYISKRFDSDGEHAPDSLSEDSVIAMLPDHNETDNTASVKTGEGNSSFSETYAKSAPMHRFSRRLKAIAACLVIALIAIPVYRSAIAPPDTSTIDGELYTFGSYDEIKRLLKNLSKEDMILTDVVDSEKKMQGESTSDMTDSGRDASSDNHSSTYLQVEDVDEADIVKTDGKYIYYVNEDSEVVILSARNGKTEKLSVIGYGDTENYVSNIFLKGDILITVGWVYEGDDGYTGVVTYDISDRTKPVVIKKFRQSGYIVSSRMVDNFVYLVTNQYVDTEHPIPLCTIGNEYTKMPVEDICCVPDPSSPSYTILSAIDINSGEKGRTKSKAVFGTTDTIYCNNQNLYAAVGKWEREKDTYKTFVLRAKLDGLKIKFDKTAEVGGTINDQFSMDETGGYFRIATTDVRAGISVNNLYILDEKLKETGKISGFARNESIKSVRFLGDRAYVITYEQIDPLFVIDVSDPSAPEIEGEVKIDGFSSLLVPLGRDRLLGIGYATGDNGYGGEFEAGLKLALFDTGNPSEPKVIDSKEFKDTDSPAQTTHLALTVNKKEGWFAIPYWYNNSYDAVVDDSGSTSESGEEDITQSDDKAERNKAESGVLVFKAKDKIEVTDRHKLSDNYLYRSVYIDNYIYALDSDGNVYSFKY